MKENLETKKKYNIKSYPTLLLFENGTLIKRIVGFSSKKSTENKIASSLFPSNHS